MTRTLPGCPVHGLVRRDDLVQRVPVHRQPRQRPGAEGGRDVACRLIERGRGDVVEQDEPEHDVGGHAGPDRQHRVGCLRRVADDHRVRPGHGQVELEVRAQCHLNDPVHLPGRAAWIWLAASASL